MAKLKSVATSSTYQALYAETQATGEHNDCSVKAVSLATGVSYTAAKDALAARGRKDRRGTFPTQINAAIGAFGFRLEPVTPREIISSYSSPHRNVLLNITTHHPRRFAKVWPKGTFLMYTCDHVLTCIDGVVHDWTINKAKRVTAIYRIVG